MIHIITKYGKRVVYDTNSHKAHHLSPLAVKMLTSLTPPLREGCPSPLRYAFAKYDSGDLSEAYNSIYALYASGDLFAETPLPEAKPKMGFVNYGDELPDTETVIAAIPLDSENIDKAAEAAEKEAGTVLAPVADYADSKNAEAAAKLAERLGFIKVCPIHKVTKENEQFSETVKKLREQGFSLISVIIADGAANTPESTAAEYDKIMKNIVRSHDTGITFLPFRTDYIKATAKKQSDSEADACAGCIACGICTGTHTGAECDIIKLQTECALIAEAE